MGKTIHEAPRIDESKIKRYHPSIGTGLSSEQIEQRFDDGLYNHDTQIPTKSIRRIFYDNIVTLFNVLNILLGLAVFLVGSYKNMLFLGVMFFNTTIGIFQEVRAKLTIDKLSIVSASKVTAIRDGEQCKVAVNDIVLDDIVEFTQGNQIPVDCIVLSGECEVNESLLTGESDAIHKFEGDMLLSGSYIVSGRCFARVEHVGADNYAAKISAEAKYIKKVNSEILYTLQKIIRVLTAIILPLSIILFLRQYSVQLNMPAVENMLSNVSPELQQAVVNTVASVIGMIPEGLVLLTSTVLAVSVIRLSRYKVLVQELYCIETLARVDVLCLDKTGTITEGCMEVADTVVYDDSMTKDKIASVMCGITAALNDTNATFNALKERFHDTSDMTADKTVPFASERKWSGAHFKGHGSYVMGAPEFILKEIPTDLKKLLNSYAKNYRALILAHSSTNFSGTELPEGLHVLGIILLNDKIRKEAPDTLRYFAEQNVEVKIISGDNPVTVSDVARRAGVRHYEQYVDATTLTTDEQLTEAIQKYTVFGRVTPAQKKKFVVALKSKGHTVAMTGDGVNDVLALKEADCSIAMAAGSDAARNVSQLVLLDSNFASMPRVVAEGRRTINNIQRSSILFIVKSIFSTLLAVLFLFIAVQYPYQPIQLTLVNMFTIGIPSFILALERNKERIKGIFILNILKQSIPAGLTTVLNVILSMAAMKIFALSPIEYSTLAVCLTAAAEFMILFEVSMPFNKLRAGLFAVMLGGFTVGVLCFRNFFGINFFNFSAFTLKLFLIMFILILISLGTYILLTYLTRRLWVRVDKKFEGKTFRPDR